MFRWFKKKSERQTITEKIMLHDGKELTKTYDITFDPEETLKEIHAMAKDGYPFKTIMAALDSVQIRLNNIECRIMDLQEYITRTDKKIKPESKKKGR